MEQLFQFIYRQRAFLLFVLLEIGCLWLVFKNNNYQSAAFFKTSNYYAAKGLAVANTVREYINLRNVNYEQAEEIKKLRAHLTQVQARGTASAPTGYLVDSAVAARFTFKVAKVINSFTPLNARFNNYLTIDKGTADGIRKGMGVISSTGVVGKVQDCTEHFSTIASLLHSNTKVSSKITRNSVLGSATWDGHDPGVMQLEYIPRHQSVQKGDTIVTSDLNAVYPGGIMVGVINRVNLRSDDAYYKIDMRLSTNFNTLSYVYVIQNRLLPEQDSLEVKTSTNPQ